MFSHNVEFFFTFLLVSSETGKVFLKIYFIEL